MKTKRPLLRLVLSGLMLTLLFGTNAYSEALELEEIIVTAERREASLQEVPISITAFGVQQLENRGIDELDDLGSHVPNLSLSPFPVDNNTVRLVLRGLGQLDAQITQDPSVALYIDGVYVGTSVGSGLEVAELERVEVLRGPAGDFVRT